MELEALIRAFAERLDSAPPEPDDGGVFAFIFDEELSINVIPSGREAVILSATVCRVPERERDAEEFLKKLLKINLAGMKEQREVLCLDRETREVIIYLKVGTDGLSAADFEETMEGFVNTLEYWCRSAVETPQRGPMPFPGISL